MLRIAADGAYHPVEYDAETGLPHILESEFVKPQSLFANEVNAFFDDDLDYKQDEVLRRSAWQFTLIMVFPIEVDLTKFESLLMEKIILSELPQKPILKLTSATYEHPPTHDPPSGTKVTYSFTVELGRR